MGHIFYKKKKPKGYAKIRRKAATVHTASTLKGEKFVRMLDTLNIKSFKELKGIDPVEIKKVKKALERGVPYYGAKNIKGK